MITVGIDIGSSSSKVVILQEGTQTLSQVIIPAGTGSSGPQRALNQALSLACCEAGDIAYLVATGYGRRTFPGAHQQFSEITCHALGVLSLFPGTRSIIDIGGQDAKAILLSPQGFVTNFVMNDKCAAGTGRFLEVMSRVLETDISQMAALGSQAHREAIISSTCTVFAESEVISQLAAGTGQAEVAAGAIRSVVRRVVGLAQRVGVMPPVIMTGGVSLNHLVVNFMEEELGIPVAVPPAPQLTGALGAALLAYRLATEGK